jgi:hypothetical protein
MHDRWGLRVYEMLRRRLCAPLCRGPTGDLLALETVFGFASRVDSRYLHRERCQSIDRQAALSH